MAGSYLHPDGLYTTDNFCQIGNIYQYVYNLSINANMAITRTFELFDTQTTGVQMFDLRILGGRGGGMQQWMFLHTTINLSSYPIGNGTWRMNHYQDNYGGLTYSFFKSGTKIYLSVSGTTTATMYPFKMIITSHHPFYPTYDGSYTDA